MLLEPTILNEMTEGGGCLTFVKRMLDMKLNSMSNF